ncbi:uncharacterized protein BX663DRAFT_25558 [Cokeromyces recurvatus]|uniref:uncharacterized protein n=1 Tax=Cokeromyces recurvatus TaxID=90255 RepID=UPI00221F6779|nr:uncharacterized protein BX663DRAFT_25558 [Cokeromyces recurvatus]KAI7908234.1 hypothetical protein BX663DRAFT_25558 [Cokeromyces recurvatus]
MKSLFFFFSSIQITSCLIDFSIINFQLDLLAITLCFFFVFFILKVHLFSIN